MASRRRVPKGHDKQSKANSKYWRTQADRLWGKIIHEIYGQCAAHGKGYGDCKGTLEAHHLISRQRGSTRHAIENGCLLCAHHHRWSPDCSPHMGPLGFVEMLQEHHPEQWLWYTRNRHNVSRYNYRDRVKALEAVMQVIDCTPEWMDGGLYFS